MPRWNPIQVVGIAALRVRCFFVGCDPEGDEVPVYMPAAGGGTIWMDTATCRRCKKKELVDIREQG